MQDWKVYVNEAMFWKKLKSLETILAERQGAKRGWFTYTELQNLLHYIDAYVLIQKIACIMTILAVTYTAGILAMVGSMIITNHVTGIGNGILHTGPSAALPSQSVNDSQIINATQKTVNRSMDAADVLKTGILLASIKVLPQSLRPTCNTSEDDTTECISWDWWNNPLMQWLTEKSEMLENIEFPFQFDGNVYSRYLEISSVFSKKMELEDHIDKATKIRIQEQMERSWHKEWTDTVYEGFSNVKLLLHYLQNVKS